VLGTREDAAADAARSRRIEAAAAVAVGGPSDSPALAPGSVDVSDSLAVLYTSESMRRHMTGLVAQLLEYAVDRGWWAPGAGGCGCGAGLAMAHGRGAASEPAVVWGRGGACWGRA
jgi:hypothetical protein